MLRLIRSNRLELLTDHLATRLSQKTANPIGDVQRVVVPHTGVDSWLRRELADRLGVVMRLSTPLSREFVWECIRRHLADAPKRTNYLPSILRWALLEWLQQADMPLPLAEDASSVERFYFCHMLANLLISYALHRPEWTLEEFPHQHQHAQWQQDAWLWLRKHMSDEPDRSALMRDLVDSIKNGQQQPEEAHIFAPAIIQPDMYQLLDAAQHSETFHLSIYHLECSQGYIQDLFKSDTEAASSRAPLGTRMVTALGTRARDMQKQLTELGYQAEEEAFFAQDNAGTNLLSALQEELLLAGDTWEDGARSTPPLPKDDSLVIRSCHEPLREVEVLRDFLLEKFAANPELGLEDVLVMAPNIQDYKRFLDAVFACADESLKLPHRVSDIPGQHPLIDELAGLLKRLAFQQPNKGPEPISLRDLAQLTDLPEVRQRFRLNADELVDIYRALEVRGGTFGLSSWEEYEDNPHPLAPRSLEAGLERLLRTALLLDGVQPHDQLLSYESLEGLLRLIRQLAGVRAQALQARQTSQWRQVLSQLCDLCAPQDSSGEQAKRALLSAGNAVLNAREHIVSPTVPLDAGVFAEALQLELSTKGLETGYLSGVITCCSLEPLRTVPAKVVCVLGLNDGNFPRTGIQHDLNLLLAEPPRPGDPNRRQDDLHLFLHLVSGARETLYLSYVGVDRRDGHPLSPSLPLASLTAYLKDVGVEAVVEQATRLPTEAHGDSFAREWLPTPADLRAEMPPPKGILALSSTPVTDPQETILAADLGRFFASPVLWWARIQGLELPREANLWLNDENLTPSGLWRWQWRQATIAGLLPDNIKDQPWPEQMPPKPGDDLFAEKVHNFSEEFVAMARSAGWGKGEKEDICANIAGKSLKYETKMSISAFSYEDGTEAKTPQKDRMQQWLWTASRSNADRLVNYWIHHLVFCVHAQQRGYQAQTLTFLTDQQAGKPKKLIYQHNYDAEALLAQLLRFYELGQERLVHFLPGPAQIVVEKFPDPDMYAQHPSQMLTDLLADRELTQASDWQQMNPLLGGLENDFFNAEFLELTQLFLPVFSKQAGKTERATRKAGKSP